MRGPSPTAAAAQYVKSVFPSNTIVLFDLSMRPAVEGLLPRFQPEAIEAGLKRYYDQTQIPLVLLADGGSHDPDAHAFAWPESDAYGKLTRNHYRVVTADAITAAERYAPIEGVLAPAIDFRAPRSFRPADVLKNRDARTVAVELRRIEQR